MQVFTAIAEHSTSVENRSEASTPKFKRNITTSIEINCIYSKTLERAFRFISSLLIYMYKNDQKGKEV